MNTEAITADRPAARQPKRRRTPVWLEFLSSMPLAITLLVVVAITSIIGTVLQQNQPYNDYIIKFGPFWFEFFRTLQLYDVYHAVWFLAILAFLVVSTSVCVYRNTPGMLREMREWRADMQNFLMPSSPLWTSAGKMLPKPMSCISSVPWPGRTLY